MLKRADLYNMNFFHKSPFKGSLTEEGRQKSFCIEKVDNTFLATLYPYSICYELAEESQKETATFDFSEDGLYSAVEWINTNIVK